ncbi:hypothetical protein BC827DRAFT_1152797 [Russula dissimulans]|nr:hypothetical protein BC827DRAFT_1152797 [Russula dissimulans]
MFPPSEMDMWDELDLKHHITDDLVWPGFEIDSIQQGFLCSSTERRMFDDYSIGVNPDYDYRICDFVGRDPCRAGEVNDIETLFDPDIDLSPGGFNFEQGRWWSGFIALCFASAICFYGVIPSLSGSLNETQQRAERISTHPTGQPWYHNRYRQQTNLWSCLLRAVVLWEYPSKRSALPPLADRYALYHRLKPSNDVPDQGKLGILDKPTWEQAKRNYCFSLSCAVVTVVIARCKEGCWTGMFLMTLVTGNGHFNWRRALNPKVLAQQEWMEGEDDPALWCLSRQHRNAVMSLCRRSLLQLGKSHLSDIREEKGLTEGHFQVRLLTRIRASESLRVGTLLQWMNWDEARQR